jgi:hypothetical protein
LIASGEEVCRSSPLSRTEGLAPSPFTRGALSFDAAYRLKISSHLVMASEMSVAMAPIMCPMFLLLFRIAPRQWVG